MGTIGTHVLDTSTGRTVPGLTVALEARDASGRWREVGRGATDADGRVRDLAGGAPLEPGAYRLVFATGPYLRGAGKDTLYHEIHVVFEVRDPAERLHLPLLLGPFGYTTYRGS